MFIFNSNTSTKTMMNAHYFILMLFISVEATLHTKAEKHKLQNWTTSLTSEARHFDALTHNLYFCA